MLQTFFWAGLSGLGSGMEFSGSAVIYLHAALRMALFTSAPIRGGCRRSCSEVRLRQMAAFAALEYSCALSMEPSRCVASHPDETIVDPATLSICTLSNI